MKRTLKRVSVLQAGKITGILYACLAVVFIPFVMIAIMAQRMNPNHASGPFAFIGLGFAIFMPVIYGVMGFILGVISAAIYNLVASWVGGLEFEVEESPAAT
jgi:hypothetical protein